MISKIYTFDNKDYTEKQVVTLTFNVEIHCIESFLKKMEIRRLNKNGLGYTIDSKKYVGLLSNKIREYKKIHLTLTAYFMYLKLKLLGFSDDSEIRNNIDIYRYEFDKKMNDLL